MVMGQNRATRFQTALKLTTTQANYAVLRCDDTKYVHFNGGVPPILFDLKVDPTEQHNIATQASSTPELNRLSSMMLDHRMTHANHALSNHKLTDKGLVVGDR